MKMNSNTKGYLTIFEKWQIFKNKVNFMRMQFNREASFSGI